MHALILAPSTSFVADIIVLMPFHFCIIVRETIGELAMQSSHTCVVPLILYASDECRLMGELMIPLSCLLAEILLSSGTDAKVVFSHHRVHCTLPWRQASIGLYQIRCLRLCGETCHGANEFTSHHITWLLLRTYIYSAMSGSRTCAVGILQTKPLSWPRWTRSQYCSIALM
jgi:hypothetical protein